MKDAKYFSFISNRLLNNVAQSLPKYCYIKDYSIVREDGIHITIDYSSYFTSKFWLRNKYAQDPYSIYHYDQKVTGILKELTDVLSKSADLYSLLITTSTAQRSGYASFFLKCHEEYETEFLNKANSMIKGNGTL